MESLPAVRLYGDQLQYHVALEWEHQAMSSALYIVVNGRVVAIRATVEVRPMDVTQPPHVVRRSFWDVRDYSDIDPEAPKYRGRIGKILGSPYRSQKEACEDVDRMILSGTLPVNITFED